MADSPELVAAQEAFRDELVAQRLLIPTGVPGVYGRSHIFEDIIERFDDLITASARGDGAQRVRFPPVLNRTVFEKSDYLQSMPQLAGAILTFKGSPDQHEKLLGLLHDGQDWSECLDQTDVVMTPAACYPLYPTIAAEGPLGPEGRLMDVYSYCFRHEPSPDPARMQIFRMREFVRLAPDPEQVVVWRDLWQERGLKLLKDLGLDGSTAPANDPFFGRGGRLLAINQRDQKLKFELVYPITSAEKPTALMSFNYHQDHFGTLYGLQSQQGAPAHTACVGFGMERIALALLKTHGLDPEKWPAAVRQKLWP
jgi:seryl-tRNA synthetase